MVILINYNFIEDNGHDGEGVVYIEGNDNCSQRRTYLFYMKMVLEVVIYLVIILIISGYRIH